MFIVSISCLYKTERIATVFEHLHFTFERKQKLIALVNV